MADDTFCVIGIRKNDELQFSTLDNKSPRVSFLIYKFSTIPSGAFLKKPIKLSGL